MTEKKKVVQTVQEFEVESGRVTQRGDSLTVSTELIDARDNSHIWGQQYSRKSADIFALQEKIGTQ